MKTFEYENLYSIIIKLVEVEVDYKVNRMEKKSLSKWNRGGRVEVLVKGFQNRSSDLEKGLSYSSSTRFTHSSSVFVVVLHMSSNHLMSPSRSCSTRRFLSFSFSFCCFVCLSGLKGRLARKENIEIFYRQLTPYTSVISTQSFIRLLNHALKSVKVEEQLQQCLRG
jgi:hypothetical protein